MKPVKTLSILIISILLIAPIFSQSKIKANRFFKELSYKKSADAYLKIYGKGDDSYKVISRIADSYYFNNDTQQAEDWYRKLSERYTKEVKQEHLFRYLHTLKGNKNYKEANEVMKKINSLNDDVLLAKELSDNPDYYENYLEHKYQFKSFVNLAVNTVYSDFGSFVFNDKLYFTSAKPTTELPENTYEWNGQPFLNIYQGQIDVEQQGTDNEVLEVLESQPYQSIQTQYHESNAVITKDGQTMYFTRDNYYKQKKRTSSERKMHLKVYKATKVGEQWTNISELPFNSDEYSVGHPALSPDEKTLYFVSDKPGGFGSTDIYKVLINEDNTYGNVENLGKSINTMGREMFPFVSSDNTLYFSSDGHLGLGGLDIFEVLIAEDGTFGDVKNIQTPFNSSVDDFAFYIDENNKQGFISSNRPEGKGDDDIYSFVLNNTKKRSDYNCGKIIEGVVLNVDDKTSIANANVAIYDYTGNVLEKSQSDNNGKFSFSVDCMSDTYKLIASKETYKEAFTDIESEKYTGGVVTLSLVPPVVVEETPKEPVVEEQIVINPIYFNFGKSEIRKVDSQHDLDYFIEIMKADPSIMIKIESHTDSRGSKSYNKRLSQRRANSTKKYIISKGIAKDRIVSAIGYGETQLLNHCDDAHQKECSEEEHQLNRRSYFIIVTGGDNIKVENTPPKVIDKNPNP